MAYAAWTKGTAAMLIAVRALARAEDVEEPLLEEWRLSLPEEIEREAVAKGPIPLGTAVATGAGRLKAEHVLHGAVMGQDLQTSPALVSRTTKSCLELADELGARSLALPAFGTGVGGFPLGECAEIMVGEARGYEPRSLERIVFAVFGDEARRAFEAAL